MSLYSLCNFSYKHYSKILENVKKSFKFSNYEEFSSNDIILRHDVDVSLDAALKIGKIESDLGICSTFFILFHAELYNPFSLNSSKIVSKLIKMGHKIGLHYHSTFFVENNLDPSTNIAKEIELMESHYKTTIKVVSSHDSSISKKILLNLPEGVVDAHSEEFIKNRKYFSDSVQNWREGCLCQNYTKYEKLQVLTHPIWWTEDNKNRNQILNEMEDGELNNHKKSVAYLRKKYQNYILELENSH